MHFPVSSVGGNQGCALPRAARISTSSSICGRRVPLTCSTSAVELTEDNHRALYVPERFAHGYQVLCDKTETSYQVGEFYTPGCEGGLLYSDPAAGACVAAAGERDFGKGPAWPLLDAAGVELSKPHELVGLREDGRMILVDNCTESPGSGRPADSGRQHRRRIHGAGAHQPRSSTPFRECAWWRPITAAASERSTCSPMRGVPTRSCATTARAARRCHPRRQAGRHRRRLSAGALGADRRAGRRHRLGRIRRARVARRVPAQKRRRADERRNRRHDRPDTAHLRRQVRRDSVGLRRRRAWRADESVSLGARVWASFRA